MSYTETLAAERRRAILSLLVQDAGRGNERVLFQALRAVGLGAGLEPGDVRELLRWLAARDCLTIALVHETMMVATITDRGRLAEDGSIKIDGVAPPSAVL
jgi:hypothetical protein